MHLHVNTHRLHAVTFTYNALTRKRKYTQDTKKTQKRHKKDTKKTQKRHKKEMN
jgi:hypothetical protein